MSRAQMSRCLPIVEQPSLDAGQKSGSISSQQFPAAKIPESRVRPRRTGLAPNKLSSLSSSTLFLALYASTTRNAFHLLQITLFILPQGLCTCYSLCLECFSFPFLA